MKVENVGRRLLWLCLGMLLAFCTTTGLVPGAVSAEPAAETRTVTFTANGNTFAKDVVLPYTFKCDISTEQGELDIIIKQLYGLENGRCKSDSAPEVASGGDGKVTTESGEDGSQYITISGCFDGAATVTGTYESSGQIPYSLQITCPEPTVDVTSVELGLSRFDISVGDVQKLVATVSPDDATNKTVIWGIGGANVGAVKLYSDADCSNEVGANPTDVLAVYAKGASVGDATITATSVADPTKAASCEVTVSGPRAPISYVAWTESSQDVRNVDGGCAEYALLTESTTTLEDGRWYVVADDVTVTDRIEVKGTGHIILCDGKTLTANSGITVLGNDVLNVYAQSEGNDAGTLVANGSKQCAGIGGAKDGAGGTVYVHGGNVVAAGGIAGAGIGGGQNGSGGTVTVYGGTVTANGGMLGAGIGGGMDASNEGGITIHGGDVRATGGANAAGIGGGQNGNGGTVTVNGGTVTATGGSEPGYFGAAGIGGGGGATPGSGGTVTINGGKVVAIASGGNAVGIGRGEKGASDGTLAIAVTHGVYGSANAITDDNKAAVEVRVQGTGEEQSIDRKLHMLVEPGTVPVAVTGVSLSEKETLLNVGEAQKLTARVSPGDAVNKAVVWSVGGRDTGSVVLYSDEACTEGNEVGTDATNVLTVYAKAVAAGKAIVTATTADCSRTADCTVTVRAPNGPAAYREASWDGRRVVYESKTAPDCAVVYADTTKLEDEKWYVVNDDVTVRSQIEVNGTAHLILADGATLTVYGTFVVAEDDALNVYAQSESENTMGSLIAKGRDYYPGVNVRPGGVATFHGGRVTAEGDLLAAGIGGHSAGSCGTVNIFGGVVSAVGSLGAGIGSGGIPDFEIEAGKAIPDAGTVNIYGGVVNATGGQNSAGIGGGQNGNGGTLTVNGGIVTATGWGTKLNDLNCAGIGGSYRCTGGTVTINGGTVIANGGFWADAPMFVKRQFPFL